MPAFAGMTGLGHDGSRVFVRAGWYNVLSDWVGLLPERMAASRRNPFQHRAREIIVRMDNGKPLGLFTNDLEAPADQIAALNKERWQIELFFKWIKQNLAINRFIGTSENACPQPDRRRLHRLYSGARMLHARHAKPHPPIVLLRLVRTHLFVRRPVAALLQPNSVRPGSRQTIANQLILPECK